MIRLPNKNIIAKRSRKEQTVKTRKAGLEFRYYAIKNLSGRAFLTCRRNQNQV